MMLTAFIRATTALWRLGHARRKVLRTLQARHCGPQPLPWRSNLVLGGRWPCGANNLSVAEQNGPEFLGGLEWDLNRHGLQLTCEPLSTRSRRSLEFAESRLVAGRPGGESGGTAAFGQKALAAGTGFPFSLCVSRLPAADHARRKRQAGYRAV
jgi:hypothetical protein